jgi:hypothetical protein
MDINQFIAKRQKQNTMPQHPTHSQDVEACNAIQIHTTGARPAYESKRGFITPETYQKKFDTLFQTRLLNRHPNENPSHYNWRLSVYSPVAKEIFDKFMSLCKGSILQPNNYSISADDRTNEYLTSYKLDSVISDMIEFISVNPIGYIGVISKGEITPNEPTRPTIIMISPENMIMNDGESMAFMHDGKYWFVNNEIQAEVNIKSGVYVEYTHNFGELPIWRYSNSFLQPYQFWSDLLVRNMNDDEAMVKHYSYPKLQIVEQECSTCMGQKLVPDLSQPYDANNPCTTECNTCHGRGTISWNPGDFLTISEETIMKNGGNMYDLAKFITPDVGIPEYHLKRWQTFYERVENSLFISPTNIGVQSGDAKKEDRKDQYIFLQTVSNFLFEQVRKSVRFISKYLNVTNEDYPIYIVQPKQFDLMSDTDLVNEFAVLQTKTDDSQTLGELNFVVNNKIFRDDSVQLKINEVMYYTDPLFGVSGMALKSKVLSGIYSTQDLTIHEKGYKILLNISRELTEDVFIESDTNVLKAQLLARIDEITPQGVYG